LGSFHFIIGFDIAFFIKHNYTPITWPSTAWWRRVVVLWMAESAIFTDVLYEDMEQEVAALAEGI
jgi:hypothetical protein